MTDIVDTAVAAGSFKTLVAAVQAAGLVDTLKSKGPFTVFAPDDEAFSKLPAGTVDALLKDVPKLKAILLYHVLPEKLTVDEVGQMNTAATVQGQEVKIDAHKWHLHMNPKINDAKITSKDIVTDNGIIHVLDRVIMPNMDLTCPVCSMGFMNADTLKAHTEKGHVAEKTVDATPMPPPPAEVMQAAEKAPEPMPAPEVVTAQVAATAKAPEGLFEVMCDGAGTFRFHLKAANGEIIAASQSYGTRENALKGIASIKKNAPVAKTADFTEETMPEPTPKKGFYQDPVFEIMSDVGQKYRFRLKAENGEIVAASQSYKSRTGAEKGIASIKKNAPTAKIVDYTIVTT
jgi:uncharacterized protein YegP (UPF0339 family)